MTKGTKPTGIRALRFWKESGSVDGDHHARSLDDGVGLVTNLQAEVLGGIRRDRRNDFLLLVRVNVKRDQRPRDNFMAFEPSLATSVFPKRNSVEDDTPI